MPRGYGTSYFDKDTCDVPAKNPKPEAPMSLDTGNAGLDGYSVLSRASRRSGVRPAIGGEPDHGGYGVPVIYED